MGATPPSHEAAKPGVFAPPAPPVPHGGGRPEKLMRPTVCRSTRPTSLGLRGASNATLCKTPSCGSRPMRRDVTRRFVSRRGPRAFPISTPTRSLTCSAPRTKRRAQIPRPRPPPWSRPGRSSMESVARVSGAKSSVRAAHASGSSSFRIYTPMGRHMPLQRGSHMPFPCRFRAGHAGRGLRAGRAPLVCQRRPSAHSGEFSDTFK